MTTLTPEQLERVKQGRATLKANPSIADDLIAKLSPAAQGPAKQLRDVFLSDETDPAAMKQKVDAIKATVPEDVKKELLAHRVALGEKLGLPPCDQAPGW